MPSLRSLTGSSPDELPHDLIRIKRRGAKRIFKFKDTVYTIASTKVLPAYVELFPEPFRITSEWREFEIVRKSRLLLSGSFADGTPVIYRAALPTWRGEDVTVPGHWEFFIGDQSYIAHRDERNRMFALDEKGNRVVEARVPWEDSEAGVEWIVQLHYKLDDLNVQLGLVLAPWAIDNVMSWRGYNMAMIN